MNTLINEIIKCNQYDLMKTKAKAGQMYFLTDIRALYKDNGNNIEQRLRFNANILYLDSERTNSIKPVVGKFYYVQETNCLWLYDTRWVLKIGNTSEYNTYTYSNSTLSPVINTDTSISGKYGDKIIDNNGLLGDGSVVIRDNNKLLKGILSIDSLYNSMHIKSYVDDGLLFIPNAHLPYNDLSTSLGALHLTVEKNNTHNGLTTDLVGAAYYYGTWNTYGDMYLIQKDDVSMVYPNYIPVNEFEIVKFYIKCTTTRNERAVATHFVIRPISSNHAIVQILSTYETEEFSVVQNDLGELLFTNAELIENVTLECTRKIIDDGSSFISEYVLDTYNATITLSQKYNSDEINAIIPNYWCDNNDTIVTSVNKWIKDKVLTSKNNSNDNKQFIHRMTYIE